MIKAIIFDFGNVICRFTNEIYLKKLSDLSGKTVDEIRKIIFENSNILKKFESGKINGQEFYRELSKMCGIDVPCGMPRRFMAVVVNGVGVPVAGGPVERGAVPACQASR